MLGEEVFVSWANENLVGDGVMVIVEIPEAQRKAEAPVRFQTGLRSDLVAKLMQKDKASGRA